MIWWTGLAPWEFDFPFPGSLTSTFLEHQLINTFAGTKVAGAGRFLAALLVGRLRPLHLEA